MSSRYLVATVAVCALLSTGIGYASGRSAPPPTATASSNQVVSQLRKLNSTTKSMYREIKSIKSATSSSDSRLSSIESDTNRLLSIELTTKSLFQQLGYLHEDDTAVGLLYVIAKNTYEVCQDATLHSLCSF